MEPQVAMILIFFAVVGHRMLATWNEKHTCRYCGGTGNGHEGGCPYEGIDWRDPRSRL